MNKRSFFFQLLAGSLIIVGAVLVVLSVAAYAHLDRNYRQEQVIWQRRTLMLLRENFAHASDASFAHIQADCRRMADYIGRQENRVTFIAPTGEVLGDSAVDNVASMELHHTRPEVAAALKGNIGDNRRRSETTGREYSYMAAPVFDADGRTVEAVVRLAVPIRALVEGRRAIARALAWAAMLAALVSGGLALLVSRLWSRPLVRITQTAGRLADGDLQARAELGGSVELETLAKALNEMRVGLAEKLQTIADQRENLRTVLTNLRDGVIAMDADRNIVYMNHSAAELLNLGDEEHLGRHVQSVVREPAILDLLRDLDAGRQGGRPVRLHHGPKRRTLDVHAAAVPSGGPSGIRSLLVMNDITEIDRIATIKSEFVANASHELRTPLATLRVAVDSIIGQYRKDGEQGRLSDILDRQLRRLEHMTADLLDLHWVENAGSSALDDEIEAASLFASLNDRFGDPAADAGIRLTMTAEPEDLSFRSDRRMLELVLHNLLDNAIKFTPADGAVALDVRRTDASVRLSVIDTGRGIPADARDRIFERFYQVDSSRTGDSVKRGTGLGLAIVKYAVGKIGGKITLTCPETGGTTFTLELPA